MKVSKVLLAAAIIGATTIMGVSTAYAWHPKGVITKKVQNITTGSAISEANTKETAVAAKPGDKLKYIIEVRNDAAPASNKHNDMEYTVMTDALPDGVALENSPATRKITENIGLIEPGKKVVKEYTVVVTASANTVIENIACFTGDSAVKDNPQEGCNPAFVTVTVPPKPEEPKPPVTVTTSTPPQMPTELPKTGATESILGSAAIIGLAWYAIHRYINSRRELRDARQ